jgi:hypothetical protein
MYALQRITSSVEGIQARRLTCHPPDDAGDCPLGGCAVRFGQYDDLDTPAIRAVYDDDKRVP